MTDRPRRRPSEQSDEVRVPLPEPRKGRGAVSTLAHRFESVQRETDADALEHARVSGEDDLPPLATTVTHERVRSLIAYNESPDIPFDRSINPYRGCEHGCIYCYARPTHSYLNLSPGLDFETRLVAKINAVEVLRKELASARYSPQHIALGTATDAYQPIEREFQLTRSIMQVLNETHHPFSVVTKSSLIERDLDLLTAAAQEQRVLTFISITTLDHALSRKLEPRAASPTRRLRTVETLAKAGVPVHVNVAPIIPFVSEPELEQILKAAREAGARKAHYTVLRLPWEVAPLFKEWLDAHFPERAERVMNRVRDMRGGKDYEAQFGRRMKGDGLWADLIRQRFHKTADKLGFAKDDPVLRCDLFVPPAPAATPQLGLF